MGNVTATATPWPVIRRRAVLVAVLVVGIGGVFTLDWLVDKTPLELPISLDPPGAIDINIWIPLRERYFLEFEFSRQGHSFEQLKQLIGEWFPQVTDGVPVAVSWSLTSRKTKEVVAQGTTVAKGAQGWSGTDVFRRVDTIRVDPGQYKFRAKIVDPVPQLASIPTRLVLWNNFKTTDTWQSSALFWGTLFTVWIVIPVTLLLVVWLIGFIGLHYWRSRRSPL